MSKAVSNRELKVIPTVSQTMRKQTEITIDIQVSETQIKCGMVKDAKHSLASLRKKYSL